MKPGDKVRILKGREEGIVRKIINEKLVEIEIEDGFHIPVMRNELVVISTEEGNYFKKESANLQQMESPQKPTKENQGIFLAFHAINDKVFSASIVNNTENIVPFTVFYQHNALVSGKTAGHLDAFQHQKIDEFERKNFEKWPEITIQALFFSPNKDKIQAPLEQKFKFKASSFFKKEIEAPLLMKKAFIFSINESTKSINIERLRENLSEGPAGKESAQQYFDQPKEVIDLHIEQLVKDYAQLSPLEILNIQLQAYEKALDLAIAGELQEITFIHGVGNGVLRDTIHKSLSKNSHVQFFKDAMKEKFGYGATLVKLT